jgi:8-oxo-dGTP pyrophosphatase MutT (NUDIX family)
MKKAWRRLRSEIVHDAGVFRLRRDAYEHLGRPTKPYYILESNPWVNVVPLTQGGEVILVRQYRHGIEEPTLEVPGGLVDEGETPAAAAARELLEETGFEGASPEPLGIVSSNPAILNNRTHCFLVRNCTPKGPAHPDPHEDVTVELRPLAEVRAMVLKGEIHHSLSACALMFLLLRRGDA